MKHSGMLVSFKRTNRRQGVTYMMRRLRLGGWSQELVRTSHGVQLAPSETPTLFGVCIALRRSCEFIGGTLGISAGLCVRELCPTVFTTDSMKIVSGFRVLIWTTRQAKAQSTRTYPGKASVYTGVGSYGRAWANGGPVQSSYELAFFRFYD